MFKMFSIRYVEKSQRHFITAIRTSAQWLRTENGRTEHDRIY